MTAYKCADPGNDITDEDADDFRAGLVEAYGTREALAAALADRISEALDLNDQIERLRESKADATLTARIAELEEQLATVNARLGAMQGPLLPFPTQDAFNRLSVLHGEVWSLAYELFDHLCSCKPLSADQRAAYYRRIFGDGRAVQPHATGTKMNTSEPVAEGGGFAPIVPGPAKDDGTGRKSAYDTTWPDVSSQWDGK